MKDQNDDPHAIRLTQQGWGPPSVAKTISAVRAV